MTPDRLRALLDEVRLGKTGLDEAIERLKTLPFEDLGFARVDHHRMLRTGHAEVIYAPGKTPSEIVAIARRLTAAGHPLLITRLDPAPAAVCVEDFPELDYDSRSRTALLRQAAPAAPAAQATAPAAPAAQATAPAPPAAQATAPAPPAAQATAPAPPAAQATAPAAPAAQATAPAPRLRGLILVVAAGTADLPVAEEACRTLEVLGQPFERLYDVGVAGLHRLLAEQQRLTSAAVLIVVAGMEGALPSVVAGLVDRPVIAVPTSTGYGAALSGLTALLGMLSSCAAGLTVVNIDNGFGAAVAAAQINRLE